MDTEIIGGIIGILGIAVAIITIYYSNLNTKKQILTSKLEELYELVQIISRHYGTFLQLEVGVYNLRSGEFDNLKNLNDYYNLRDKKLPKETIILLQDKLSRLEVLTECYTNKTLKTRLLYYEKLMFSFLDFISNGGSMYKEILFKEGYPKVEEFYALITILKQDLKSEIKK